MDRRALLLLAMGAVLALSADVWLTRISGSADALEVVRSPQHAAIFLHFRGKIDGSERIEVTQLAAIWEHVAWSPPKEGVTLNGVAWACKDSPVLLNRGETTFLSAPVDFSSATLEILKGRDTVAIEPNATGLTVFLCDSPNGSDDYEFRVHLEPARQPGVLRIVAKIDGSDELHISREGAKWIHKHWKTPSEISLNGVAWNPQAALELPNSGNTTFLSEQVRFSAGKVLAREGRGVVALEACPDHIVIRFADSPNGSAVYKLTIGFGM